jgi:flagellar biosynthesis/type III secretory pathway M-ring protein FliF/YscJ
MDVNQTNAALCQQMEINGLKTSAEVLAYTISVVFLLLVKMFFVRQYMENKRRRNQENREEERQNDII